MRGGEARGLGEDGRRYARSAAAANAPCLEVLEERPQRGHHRHLLHQVVQNSHIQHYAKHPRFFSRTKLESYQDTGAADATGVSAQRIPDTTPQ